MQAVRGRGGILCSEKKGRSNGRQAGEWGRMGKQEWQDRQDPGACAQGVELLGGVDAALAVSMLKMV